MINKMDKFKGQAQQFRNDQPFGQNPNIQLSSQRSKGERIITLSQTIEFVETRAQKLSGAQKTFKGKVLSDAQQEKLLNFEKEEADNHNTALSVKDDAERKKYIKSLNKQIKKYCINKLRDDIHLDIEENKDHIEYQTEQPRNLVDEVLKFVEGMA